MSEIEKEAGAAPLSSTFPEKKDAAPAALSAEDLER